MEATRICLVRHGETAWNAERRIQGQTDVPLAPAGVAQARAAARHLGGVPFAALYTSDLLRARQTADCLAARLDQAPRCRPEFRERRYGCFEGRTYDEASTLYPEVYAAFLRRDPGHAFPEGGESLRQLHDRVVAGLQALAAAHSGETIALVTHGGVLDIVNRFVRGLPLETARDFLIPNAGINWIVARSGQWSLEAWGDTGHLAEAGLDELR